MKMVADRYRHAA